jgi:23S rRNA pseudouridine2457 synthase
MEGYRYFILNKPYDMVSQFISSHKLALLGDIDFSFPEGIHAIGRLDKNSEGLLLLTTNKKITRLLFQGKVPHARKYLVQVRGIVSDESLAKLTSGVLIPITTDTEYTTRPCDAIIVKQPEGLFSSGYELHPNVPNTWIEVVLTEGKFHQVRKMMTAIGHPCKRLIRISIEELSLEELQPGEVREVLEEEFFTKLHLY